MKDINFLINEKDRVAIVWGNGVGKTTLVKVITWEITTFDGWIENIGNLKLGYLSQIYSDNEEKLVREELRDWLSEIFELNAEIATIEKQMEEDSTNMDLIDDYTSLLEKFNNIGWNNADNQIHGVANGMNILDLLNKKLTEISGWQRTKVALAKILLEKPDILFLDEPTNFIDIASVEWLESYLNNKWTGWYIIISHDREFLDKTCPKTYEMQPLRPINIYNANYTGYVKERDKVEQIKLADFKRQSDWISSQEKLVDRFRAWSRAGWAKSREKMLGKVEKIEAPYIPKKPKFFFEFKWESPEKIFHFKEVFIWRQEPLFYIADVWLSKWQRVGVVWENGTGKSTFFKTIIGQIETLEGHMSRGKNVTYVYYSQMHEELDKNKTVKENFEKHWLQYDEQSLIGFLAHYMFERADIDKKVSQLSGGQTSKLLFAILGQKESTVLILDEPTNHLDYDTREELEKSLQKYKWAILFISHDRYFVNKLADQIWLIENNELQVSYGNYEDYSYKKQRWLDFSEVLYDESAQMDLVLEDKLWEKEAKRIKQKFWKKKKR